MRDRQARKTLLGFVREVVHIKGSGAKQEGINIFRDIAAEAAAQYGSSERPVSFNSNECSASADCG